MSQHASSAGPQTSQLAGKPVPNSVVFSVPCYQDLEQLCPVHIATAMAVHSHLEPPNCTQSESMHCDKQHEILQRPESTVFVRNEHTGNTEVRVLQEVRRVMAYATITEARSCESSCMQNRGTLYGLLALKRLLLYLEGEACVIQAIMQHQPKRCTRRQHPCTPAPTSCESQAVNYRLLSIGGSIDTLKLDNLQKGACTRATGVCTRPQAFVLQPKS